MKFDLQWKPRRLVFAAGMACGLGCVAIAAHSESIKHIDPAESGFFTKEIVYSGIPIKAPAVVSDDALFAARDRMKMMLDKLPAARYNLMMAGAELQIIGKDQGTSDLPDYRGLKGKPFDGNLTVDQRTRGLGGRHTSCGEENLLKLPVDRYRGRDICIHEFGHCIQDYGLDDKTRALIEAQMKSSLAKGHWVGAYSGSNVSEFFAELGMWYFGTHGDLHMTGEKPENGLEGLRKYDPEAYALLDNLYKGRLPIDRLKWTKLEPIAEGAEAAKSGHRGWRRLIRFENRTGDAVTLTREGKSNDDDDLSPLTLPKHGAAAVEARLGTVWDANVGGKNLRFAATEERGLAEIR